jgi:hypothetical protein
MANVNNMVPNNRFELLKNEILDYETAKNSILTGVEDYERIMYLSLKTWKMDFPQ